ncbi:MAG: GNAT family N-acetyltransferase [Rhodocyclaceae bacterium]|nr:GNAT family N-acetyltransferase [Rhodocyclaceae bacterium]
MNAPLRLRTLRDEDDAFLRHLYACIRKPELDLLNWDAGREAAFLQTQFDSQQQYYHTFYPGAQFDLVMLGDEPIGCFYVLQDGGDFRVIDLAILPEHRGNGYATAVLTALMHEAHRAGCSVSIHLEPYNPAVSLYQRLGFREVRMVGLHRLMQWQP